MNPKIIFENDDVVVINKPSGLITHPDGRNKVETVSDWFVGKYPGSAGVGAWLCFLLTGCEDWDWRWR